MAQELSRTFDTQAGAIYLTVKDSYFGHVSPHTVYVLGVSNVADAITALLARVDDEAKVIYDAMIASGWTPNGS